MEEEFIGHRIKRFLDETEISLTEIANEVDIPESTLRSILNGHGKDTFEKHSRLKNYLERKGNTAQEPDIKEKQEDYETPQKTLLVRIALSGPGKVLPFDEPNIGPGTVYLAEQQPELIAYRIEAPVFGEINGIIEIVGHSMDPTYKPHQKVGIVRLEDIELLDYGECYYIIDNNNFGKVKRVYEASEKDKIKMISDNPDQAMYPPIDRELAKIMAIFKVIDLS